MATRKIERLEKILQCYEDNFWGIKTLLAARGESVENLPPASFLRTSLQRNERVDGLCNFLWSFASMQKLDPDNLWKRLYDAATDLADWVHGSRRIFRVSRSLAEMLLETELPEFLPRQVKFVAPAFAVLLEEPAFCPAQFQLEHDFLIFSKYKAEDLDGVSIRSYAPGYDSYVPLSPEEKSAIRKLMEKGGKFEKRALKKISEKSEGCNFTGFDLICPEETPFNAIIEVKSEETEAQELLFRLCFGLNLYLQSARSNDQERRSVVRSRPSSKGESVVRGAKLFELSVSEAFIRPSRSNGHSGHEISPHFRRGFWRRPKGQGNDPDAPKTEWVRPTWVRRDKITEGESPIGSFQGTDVQ